MLPASYDLKDAVLVAYGVGFSSGEKAATGRKSHGPQQDVAKIQESERSAVDINEKGEASDAESTAQSDFFGWEISASNLL